MTIQKAITMAAELKHHPFDDSRLIGWLNDLDGEIYHFIGKFEESDEVYTGYMDSDISTQLLATAPYDAMYPRYLAAQIDFAMEEYERYNASAAAFNAGLESYKRHITRTRMPKKIGTILYPKL